MRARGAYRDRAVGLWMVGFIGKSYFPGSVCPAPFRIPISSRVMAVAGRLAMRQRCSLVA